jgi:ribonuclease HI
MDYFVYTDGSCSRNGYEGAKAGIGIYFGENDSRNVSELLEGKVTNNIAELKAILKCFSIIESDLIEGKQVTIVSDSEYAIRCATTYGKKCANVNWKKDIPNKELVQTLYEITTKYSNVQFLHIKAHTNNNDIHSIGNKHADLLATLFNS